MPDLQDKQRRPGWSDCPSEWEVRELMGTLTKKRLKGTLVGSNSRSRPVSPQSRKKLTNQERATEAGKFAAHLQRLLSERGWTTHDLAERISVSEPAVRRWMRAEALPGSLSLFKEVGKALNTSEHPFPEWRLVLPNNV